MNYYVPSTLRIFSVFLILDFTRSCIANNATCPGPEDEVTSLLQREAALERGAQRVSTGSEIAQARISIVGRPQASTLHPAHLHGGVHLPGARSKDHGLSSLPASDSTPQAIPSLLQSVVAQVRRYWRAEAVSQAVSPDHPTLPSLTPVAKWGTVFIYAIAWVLMMWPLWIPMGRPGTAMVFAILACWFRFACMGILTKADLGVGIFTSCIPTILLLFGLMIVCVYLKDTGFWDSVEHQLDNASPKRFMIKVCVFSGLASCVLLNDTISFVLPPLVLRICKKNGARTALPYLLAISTSANIGSSLTTIGNPQNALIATICPGIEFLPFVIQMLFPVAMGMLVNMACLLVYFRTDLVFGVKHGSEVASDEYPGLHSVSISSGGGGGHDGQSPRALRHAALPRNGFPSMTKKLSPWRIARRGQRQRRGTWHGGDRRKSRTKMQDEGPGTEATENWEGKADKSEIQDEGPSTEATENWEGKANKSMLEAHVPSVREHNTNGTWAYIAVTACCVIVMVVGLISGGTAYELVLYACAILIISRAAWRASVRRGAASDSDQTETEFALDGVDFPLLILFVGQFVLVGLLMSTGFPPQWFNAMLGHGTIQGVPADLASLLWFTTFIVLICNLISNVPAIIMLQPVILNLPFVSTNPALTPPQKELLPTAAKIWIIIAWIATVSGNLTMLGSAANQIVAYVAGKCGDNTYNSTSHIKFSFLPTIVILIFGTLALAAEADGDLWPMIVSGVFVALSAAALFFVPVPHTLAGQDVNVGFNDREESTHFGV